MPSSISVVLPAAVPSSSTVIEPRRSGIVPSSRTVTPGAAIRWDGQVGVFDHRPGSPCYQCLYARDGQEDLRCSENGVVAPLVGVIGAVQALEAIKLLCGAGETLSGRLLVLDGLRMQWRELHLRADPACKVCGA